MTPNFHQKVIGCRERPVAVVLARDTGVVAVAVPRDITGPELEAVPLTFVDSPELAEAVTYEQTLTVADGGRIGPSLRGREGTDVSAYGVQYRKPESLGEALVNY